MKHKTKRGAWQTLQRADIIPEDRASRASFYMKHGITHDPDAHESIWINDTYQVAMTERETDDGITIVSLSIKRRDRAACHDWRDFQRIKNDLLGVEAEAIEIYPAESRLVDTSNQYWLWAVRGKGIGIGFTERAVSEMPWGKSRQRPWYLGDRPNDLMVVDADGNVRPDPRNTTHDDEATP